MIACPGCGFEAPDDFAFCPKCATALTPPRAAVEERKIVTTLFCDLVAFTAMSEAADPEDVDAVLRSYHLAARRVIEAHGGSVEKFIGDAVVGAFGVPVVHEDDPERAVRAGLRIIAALEGMNRPDGTPLEARCGVNTGEALVRLDVTSGSGEGLLTGDAVNTAARLQTVAPSMGVVVGELTHMLTAQAFTYSELEPLELKGKADTVRAWLAGQPVARTGLRTTGTAVTPFLGREDELAALHDTLWHASRASKAHVVLLVGEPGIGKSRLVLEFARSLDERPGMVTWRQGRCLPYGEGVTFWALGEILKGHAGILDSDDVASAEAKLEAVLPEGEDKPWLRQRLRPLLGLEASQAAREENFAAWTRFLELVSGVRPTVLVLEDLHWAGEGMLAFVEHLLVRELEAPLLIVATTRPELLRQHEGALTAAAGDGPARRITLPTLSRHDAGALIEYLLDAELAADVGARIVDLAGGNPLYAEQYVRLLLDRGLLVRAADRLRLESDGQLPLPETVQAVLAARLDTLPAEHKALLCDAAVLGETFWRGGVAALSGCEASAVDEAMTALAARDLVRPVVTPTIEGESEYLFWHALARDVAYSEVPRKVRARKHRAAALWIEKQAGERGNDFTEILVHHYEAALGLARTVGDEALAASLVAPTIDCLKRAGERTLHLDVAAAERHFARALELAGPGTSERLRLLPRWAEAVWLRNRYREAAVALEEAIAGLKADGEIRAAAAAMCLLANVLPFLAEPAGDVIRDAVDLLAEDGPSREQAWILGLYALFITLEGEEPQAVIDAATRAIDISELLALPEAAMAMSCRGSARLELGDMGGLEEFERAIAAARTQGLGVERATIEFNYNGPVLLVRGARAAHRVLTEGIDFTLRHGLDAYTVTYRVGQIATMYALGQWDQAQAQASDLMPGLEESEDIWDVLNVRSLQARILAHRGKPAEAIPFLAWVVENGRESEIVWTKALALLGASAVHLGLGETGVAASLLAEVSARTRAPAFTWTDEAEAVRIALACGDEETAACIVERLDSAFPARALPLQLHVMTTVEGALAEARGQHEPAAAGFAAAAIGWRDFEMPFEEAHALFGQGRCLVALGRAPEAAAPLAAAREIFARLGAKPAFDETESALAAADL